MGGLFSSPKKVTTPPVAQTEPAPEVVTEDIEKGISARAKKRYGRSKTIVTGELEPTPSKKTLLG